MNLGKNLSFIFASLVCLILLSQCSKKSADVPPKIASLLGNWQLVQPDSTHKVTLVFTLDEKNPPNDVTPLFGNGQSSVNQYNARFFATLDGMMVVDPIGSTKIAGEPAAMQFEQAYFNHLKAVVRYELSADELKLPYGGETPGVLIYKRVK